MPATTIYLLCTSPNPSCEFYETEKLAEYFGRLRQANYAYDDDVDYDFNIEEMTWPEGLTVFPEDYSTVIEEWMSLCHVQAYNMSVGTGSSFLENRRKDFKATVFEGRVPAFETNGKKVFLDGKLVHEFEKAFEVDILKKVLAGDV